jgi:general secretion pathway protein B
VSYILDALKKLEKERRRGRIPGLSEQDSVVYHSQRRSVLPYVMIAVFSLSAVLLIWWFLPKQPKEAVMPAAPSGLLLAAPSMSQDVKRPEIKESGNVISSGAAEPSSVSRPPVSPPARKMLQEEAQKTTSLTNSEPKAENEKQKNNEASRQEKKPEVMAEPLPDKKLYKLSELPPSVRDSLPGFSITAFLYSDSPSGRMARINERIMREGQELEPGIRIEEIVSDGVILSYKKFRFFVSVN